jgi:hypothetical protein
LTTSVAGCGLTITQNLTISGPGASMLAVSGNNNPAVGTVFCITGGIVSISGLTIENGKGAVTGSGIFNSSVLLTVSNSTISGNSASLKGGGIQNNNLMTVTNSTISGNSAPGGGGLGGGIFNSRLLTVTYSTISGNSAPGSVGGGIFNLNIATLKSTILANEPSGGNCAGGGITTLGYNLSDDATCTFGGTGDRNSTPAGLDPNGLQYNGGPTQTIALLLGSPGRHPGCCVHR